MHDGSCPCWTHRHFNIRNWVNLDTSPGTLHSFNNPQRHEEFTKCNLEPSKKLPTSELDMKHLSVGTDPPHLPHDQPFPAFQAWWDPLVSLVQRSGVSTAVEATPASVWKDLVEWVVFYKLAYRSYRNKGLNEQFKRNKLQRFYTPL